MYCSLSRLPSKYLRELCGQLLPLDAARVRPWALQAAAQLTRVAGNTIGCIWDKLKKSSWRPNTPSANLKGGLNTEAEPSSRRDADQILRLLVTESIANASAGLTDANLFRCLQRARLRAEDIGDKYHSWEFARLTEWLACRAIRALDAVEFHAPLKGLGVPTHFSIMWDGVNLGATSFSRRESLCVIACNMVSASSGRLHPRLLAAPSLGWDHGGPAQAELVRRSLAGHEAEISSEVCSRRLSALGGDGAIVRGGESAKHQSTKAAELLWAKLNRIDPPVVHWDPYHREEAARRHAASEIPMVQELFDLSAVVSSLPHGDVNRLRSCFPFNGYCGNLTRLLQSCNTFHMPLKRFLSQVRLWKRAGGCPGSCRHSWRPLCQGSTGFRDKINGEFARLSAKLTEFVSL